MSVGVISATSWMRDIEKTATLPSHAMGETLSRFTLTLKTSFCPRPPFGPIPISREHLDDAHAIHLSGSVAGSAGRRMADFEVAAA